MKRIYLDHAATTPLAPSVLEAMLSCFSEIYGNASSIYEEGRAARARIEEARTRTQRAINAARPDEIFFVSSGTEADNWALKGFAFANKDRGNHIITTNVEHHAVLKTCAFLEKHGFQVTYLSADLTGSVSAEQVEEAIRPGTILASVMTANNEIGTINPIGEIGRICRERGVVFHTDAVQAIGAVPVDVQEASVDMLSLSAHKFYGPKGVGALYVRKGIRLENMLNGGAQEHGKRGSTYNTPGIVGMGTAIERITTDIPGRNAGITKLRDRLLEGLKQNIPGMTVNGSIEHRLPGNLNVSFRSVESEAVLLHLDMQGIAASSGAACTSGSLDPSHVLLAIGLHPGEAAGSVRFTVGEENTEEEIDITIEKMKEIVRLLREMSSSAQYPTMRK